MVFLISWNFSLFQLDANLIEGEPCLHNKNKRGLKWRDKIKIYWKYGKPVFKACQNKRHSVWGLVQCHPHTVFFAPTDPPLGKKMSLVNFKRKITTSANYRDSIGTGYMSHDKELCLHGKRLKNYININQSN